MFKTQTHVHLRWLVFCALMGFLPLAVSGAEKALQNSVEDSTVSRMEQREQSETEKPQPAVPKRKKRSVTQIASPPPPHPAAIRETHEVPPVPESPQQEETRLTKNWGGARKILSDQGIDLGVTYKGEFNRVLFGGIDKATVYLGNLDVKLSLDWDRIVSWKGGSSFLYFITDHGGHPSRHVGDLQGTTNIETATRTAKIYEAWLQQLAVEDRLSILGGLHDLNSEFYVTDSSGIFLNSSFGVGKELSQTGINGPSVFPTTALALRIRVEPSKSYYLQAAAFDAQAGDPDHPEGTHFRLNAKDGLLFISEAAYLRGLEGGGVLPAKYALGFWSYTRVFDHLTVTQLDSDGNPVPVFATNHGAYFLVDQSLADALSVFFRYGVASTEVNQIGACLSAGLKLSSPIPTRSMDRIGVGWTRAEVGSEYKTLVESQDQTVSKAEDTIELLYRVELTRGVILQPDFQVVLNPGVNPDAHTATVAALRAEITF